MGVDSLQPDADRALRALVALLAADRDERVDQKPPRKSEVVLGEAGFSAQDIAGLTGKNPEAVRSTIRRLSKSKGTK